LNYIARLSRLSLAFLLFMGVACSGGGGGGDTTSPPAGSSLTVVNSTTVSVTALYISPASSGSWGTNQLSSAIGAGASRTITSITPGRYDLRAVGSDGSYAERYDVAFTAGSVQTWTLAASSGTLKIVNNYSYPITELFVSPSTASTWGANQLSVPIPVGGTLTLTDITPGTYDLKAVASDGSYNETYDASIAAGGLYTWTLTVASGSVKVVNNYSYPITELYFSPQTSSTWGANQLTTPIPVGGSFTLTGVPAGVYDLKAVASDGAYREQYDVSITAGSLYTWTLSATVSYGSLKVVNSYSYPVVALYVSSSTSTTWGVNQLTTAIPVGGSFTLTNIPQGMYDFAADASNGASWERYDQWLGDGALFTWTLVP
jgi:hypothetical protein